MSTNVPARISVQVPATMEQLGIDQTKWEVITKQFFPAAKTQESVELAVKYCKARGLDIMKRPVHIVPVYDSEKGKYVDAIWPGVNELLITAHRTKEFAGIDKPTFGPIVRREYKTLDMNVPEYCEVTAYRFVNGVKCAFSATVYFDDVVAMRKEGPNSRWQKSPRQQLIKCTNAAVLRIAFPEEIGAQYTAEEMEDQVTNGENLSLVEVARNITQAKIEEAQEQAGDVDAEVVQRTAKQKLEDLQEAATLRGQYERAADIQETLDEMNKVTQKDIVTLMKLGAPNGYHTKDIVALAKEKFGLEGKTWQKEITRKQYEELKAIISEPAQDEENE